MGRGSWQLLLREREVPERVRYVPLCVSFHELGGTIRPWGTSFGSPTLVVSAEDYPKEISSSTLAWGFLCPLLEDRTTGYVFEYCLQEWRSKAMEHYDSTWANEGIRGCESGIGSPGPLVLTQFAPGKRLAQMLPGSGSTYVWASNQYPEQHFEHEEAGHNVHYEAKITPEDLEKAAGEFDEHCAGAHASRHPGDYALIGIEQGREPWSSSNTVEIGGSSANLSMRTEYASLHQQSSSSSAIREPSTGEQWVYYTGTSGQVMEANFRPGTGGGWQTPVPISGSSQATPGAAVTAVREPETGEQWVYYTSTSGQLVEANFRPSGSNPGWQTPEVIRSASPVPGTTPSAIREPNTGEQWVYYTGTSGQVMEANFRPGTGGGWQTPVPTNASAARPAPRVQPPFVNR